MQSSEHHNSAAVDESAEEKRSLSQHLPLVSQYTFHQLQEYCNASCDALMYACPAFIGLVCVIAMRSQVGVLVHSTICVCICSFLHLLMLPTEP